jgi:uncharacterized protein
VQDLKLISILPSAIEGHGVFAREPILRGTVILRIDDSRVIDSDHPLRPECGESPVYRDFLPDGTVVLMPTPERYLNHSCNPNCYISSVRRQRLLLSNRDIAAGEELVVDYALNAIDGDHWQCRCGAIGCRGYHQCDFFALPPQLQREYLPFLDPWFAEIHAVRILNLLLESSQSAR